MKKTLTSVLALSALAFGSAQAGEAVADMSWAKPKVELSGNVKAYAMGIAGKHVKAPDHKGKIDNITAGSKGSLRFDATGQTAAGSTYGAVVALDLRRNKANTEDLWKSIYAFFSSDEYGMWQIGDLDGAMKQTIVDARNLMGGTGGFDGDMWVAATPTNGVMALYEPLSHTKYATKIVYKSPLMNGFQVAMSYTANSKLFGALERNFNNGLGPQYISGKKAMLGRVFETALSYGTSFGDVAVNLYAGGAVANPVVPLGTNESPADFGTGLRPVKTWQLGMLIDYHQFQFAAGMIDNQRSMLRRDETGDAGKAYNAGLSYTNGRHTVAVGYMGSTRKVLGGRAKANVGSLTYECALAPGWTVFGEANYFSTVNTDAYMAKDDITAENRGNLFVSPKMNKRNSGGVFLLGTAIRF